MSDSDSGALAMISTPAFLPASRAPFSTEAQKPVRPFSRTPIFGDASDADSPTAVRTNRKKLERRKRMGLVNPLSANSGATLGSSARPLTVLQLVTQDAKRTHRGG